MNLIEHYVLLRHLHVGLVAASGALFALRALARLAGAQWPLTRPARVASWVIDSGLLAAGAALWAALRIDPVGQPWLGTKLLLLLAYIGLGTMALRRARTTASRLAWTLAALGCFGFMVTVALAHHPLGLLAPR
ncbi:MAG: SirB2 family protein [Rubrivivax sp.]|nr:SirB2 family protein [Rubrivivax sp.]MCW5611537.1 SirB2 family protein [Rubrivivax sp.]